MKNRPVFHKITINTDPRVESWLGRNPDAEEMRASDEEWIREYLIHHKRSVEEMIFWEDNVAWMRNYLAVRKDYVERSIDRSIKRSYAFLDVVDRLILRAVDENCMQLRAWLVEYKSSLFDDEFIDAADSDQIDLEFELREPLPAEKHSAGKEIAMGSYCFHEDGRKEDMTWQVLDIIEDRALVISRNVIEFMQYNNEWGAMTWERCSLRKWLNEDFLEKAFSDEERGRIIRGRIRNSKNYLYETDAGPDTEDSIFLLSMEEAREYYACDEERIAFATPHAKAGAKAAAWRLRSPGYKGGCFNAFVRGDGMINTYGCLNEQHGFGVRPAMWIRL